MQPTRLRALDGIRGIAIILVILNHVPLGILYAKLPSIVHPFLTMLLVNGKTGVSLLFLLSGFLMMWLHPQPKVFSFLKKRYARVFPPFLTMVAALAVIRNIKLFLPSSVILDMKLYPAIYALFCLAVIFGLGGLCFTVWQVLLILRRKFAVGSILFGLFFAFQVAVAGWYVFYLLRVPPAVFYMEWSQLKQAVATAVVNGTLTLQFGNYIAQLDGVYWSLITEVIFYLLYPVFIIHLVAAVMRKSKLIQWLTLLTTLPFFFGLKLVFDHVLGFSIVQIHLFIYFLVGLLVAMYTRQHTEWKEKLIINFSLLRSPLVVITGLLLLMGSVLFYQWVPHHLHPWVQLIWAFPLAVVMFVSLIPGSNIGAFLEHPVLIFFGKYSFSLYLLHSVVIEVLTAGKEPDTLMKAGILTAAVFLVSVVMAKIMYMLIEEPYFLLRKSTVAKTTKVQKNLIDRPLVPMFSARKNLISISIFSALCLILVYLGYRSPFSFFSFAETHQNADLTHQLDNQKSFVLTEKPVQFEFTAPRNNLGMITTSLFSGEVKGEHGVQASDVAGLVHIRLLESDKELAASTYKVHEIGESRYHPFGFPVIPDSQGKTYILEYFVSPLDPARSTSIEASDAQFRTIYFANKQELTKDPGSLLTLVLGKITEPFVKPTAVYAVLHILPLLFLLWINVFRLKDGKIH